MSSVEAQKENEKRIDGYKAMCLGGLTSMYWKDTQSLLKKVGEADGTSAAILSECFAFAQAAMLVGLAASSFPKSSPRATMMASNGALFAVLFNIAAFHLEIYEFPNQVFLLISCLVLSAAFTMYWSLSSQDLTVVRWMVKALLAVVYYVLYCVIVIIGYPVVNLYKSLWHFKMMRKSMNRTEAPSRDTIRDDNTSLEMDLPVFRDMV